MLQKTVLFIQITLLTLFPSAFADERIDRVMEKYVKPNAPGACVAVVKDGLVIHKKGYGMANLEYGIPMSCDSVFDIASVSKQFLGFAMARLVQQKKISLDDDIRSHLSFVPRFEHPITIGHLLHHTSGLRDWPNCFFMAGKRYYDALSFTHILTLVKRQKELNFKPGEEYLYSNTGYNLLAHLVEKVTGTPFHLWTKEQIFDPLGMDHTHFHHDHTVVVKNRVCSYHPDGKGYFVNAPNHLTAMGSSSLYTTLEDLIKWVLNFEDPKVGNAATMELMLQRGVLNNQKTIPYAFGLSHGQYNHHETLSHLGGWAGFRTCLWMVPKEGLSIIVLYSCSNLPSEKTAHEIADLFLEIKKTTKDSETAKSFNHTPQSLKKFTGVYELQPAWLLTIIEKGGKLYTQATAEDRFEMTPISEYLFHVNAYGASIRFDKDLNGLSYKQYQAKRVKLSKPNPEQVQSFVGEYFSEELDSVFRVILKNNELHLTNFWHGESPLVHGNNFQYRVKIWGGCLEFVTGEKKAFLYSTRRNRNLRFIKQSENGI